MIFHIKSIQYWLFQCKYHHKWRGVQAINFCWQIWTSTMLIGAQLISLVKEGALTRQIRNLWDFPILSQSKQFCGHYELKVFDISFWISRILPPRLLYNCNCSSFASLFCVKLTPLILFCCKIWTSGMLIGAAEHQDLAQKVQFRCKKITRGFKLYDESFSLNFQLFVNLGWSVF